MSSSNSSGKAALLAVASLSVLFAVVGCAGPPALIGTGATTPTPTPTAACPHSEYIPDEGRDCVVYDPEKNMAENERYRERISVTPALQAQLDEYVGPVEAALNALPVPAGPADVQAALEANGLRYAQTLGGNGTPISWGAGDGSAGCLYGVVDTTGVVTVSTGGIIQDGGCLAMVGH